MNIDQGLLLFLQENVRNDVLNPFFICVTLSGEKGLIYILITLILVLRRNTRRLGILAAISFIICVGFAELIKNAVMRPRPFLDIAALIPLVERPDSYSLPSVHTVSAFSVTCMTLWEGVGLWRWGLLLFALLMAFSRLYVGVHYPSDVVLGILIGIAGSYGIYRYCRNRF
ncbi:MAG: phosphatase PAP2 family protein [Schwartzia sp.]|nr:phosphatase PAP2 family protein [Schwartzia sp. (in: firmicutes)]